MVTKPPCAIAAAQHNGWAALVCVGVREGIPTVVDRRRVDLIERDLPNQPYEHETHALPAREAERLIHAVRQSIARCTSHALQQLVQELSAQHMAVAFATRQPPFAALPDTVAEVHASNRLTYAADGVMYHLALCRAAEALGLDVQCHRRGDEVDAAADALAVSPRAVDDFVTRAGRDLGPPWTAEHRRACAAAIAALAGHAALRLPAR